MMEISKLELEMAKLEPSCCSMNGKSKGIKKSYIHGSTNSPLLFDTIGERLRLAARKFPDREVVIFKKEGVRKTYRELLKDVSPV